jgi:hypothetical protein
MHINFVNNQSLNFSGYLPLSKYKGILLKLTESDKEHIASLQKQITDLECNMYEYSSLHTSKKRTSDIQERNYKAYCKYVQATINSLRDKIKETKVHRLKIQKAIQSQEKLSFEKLV